MEKATAAECQGLVSASVPQLDFLKSASTIEETDWLLSKTSKLCTRVGEETGRLGCWGGGGGRDWDGGETEGHVQSESVQTGNLQPLTHSSAHVFVCLFV